MAPVADIPEQPELLETSPRPRTEAARRSRPRLPIGVGVAVVVVGMVLAFGIRTGPSVQPPLSDLGDTELVVLVGGELVQVDIESGSAAPLVPLPEPVFGRTLATAGGRLVYIGDSGAWALDPEGQPPILLGPADRLLDSGSTDHVWLGVQQEGDRTIDPMEWSEVDLEGAVRRRVVRAMPLEFPQPDIVWGFESHIYRLSEQQRHPFRLVGQGVPVAVGLNDLILNVCDAERTCHRRWFDAFTGEDRGPVLADVAANLVPDSRVWMSETGRYGVVGQDGEVDLWTIAMGTPVRLACDDARDAVWSPTDRFVGCVSAQSVVVASARTGAQRTLRFESRPADLAFFTVSPT